MSAELLALAAKAAGYRVRQSDIVAGFIDDDAVNVEELHGDDAHAATRRAIVRAAAEVGRRMGDAQ